MVIDPGSGRLPGRLEAGVVVIGGGPAGITVALELGAAGVDVLLLESGSTELGDPDVAGLTDGEWTAAEPYPLATSRARVLGGTSAVWTGHCRPLDAADFAARSWVPMSGWPIGPADLAEGYAAAQRLTEVGPEPFDLRSWRGALDDAGIRVVHRDDLTTELFRRSPPTRFGERYRPDLEASDAIRVLLRTTAVRIVTAPDGRSVRHVEAVTAAGQRVEVAGDAYVLATGGLEVPRLLLVSGIGGDLVGRCFMEHPHLHAAAVAFTSVFEREVSPLAYGMAFEVQGREVLHAFTLPVDLVAEERLLAASYSLAHFDEADDPTAPAVGALAADVAGSTPGEPRDLFLRAEQRPHPDNRVELDPRATDRFGVPRLRVHWQVHDDDLADHRRALTHVATALAAAGYGRLRPKLWAPGSPQEGVSGGHHHLGTARMSEDPAAGVVDRDLQVHGVAGLHVASSAVFPTAGHANPTLTIVALAARLAAHLAGTAGG